MSEPAVRGMISLDELSGRIASDRIDTVAVVFTDLYGRLVGKRLDAGFFLETAEKGTHACDYLLATDMEMEPVPGYRFANWEKGYGDVHLVPDLSTLRVASWLDKTAMVICDLHGTSDHQTVGIAPRSILRRQVEKAAAAGYTAMAASELEYYIFETTYREAAESGYAGLRQAGWYIEDYHMLQGSRLEPYNGAVRAHLRDSGVPVESSKGEWGRGQHELNIRYCDALSMADRHVTFKQCLKETADQMALSVTFMAKFDAAQAGSSCHMHLSLFDGGRNAFHGNNRFGPVECSDEFRWFLGGWIARLSELMPFYAPTVNSYKRYQSGSWAPTRLAWSHDNRTASFRVVGGGESLRIECRVAGADCNPYLSFAAALASGLDGIDNQTEPPSVYEGDVYHADSLPTVPGDLAEATRRFADSEFAAKAFGADVVEHYTHFFRTEQTAYNRTVTDWERRRYFERI